MIKSFSKAASGRKLAGKQAGKIELAEQVHNIPASNL